MIEALKEVREALFFYIAQIGQIGGVYQTVTKLDALIAQRAAGDDGLAQQYTKLSAHCAMLEDKLATLTAALGAKQMADFVAKHGAQEKAEPVAWNKNIRDRVDDLLAQAGYATDSSVRNALACMNFDTAPQSAPSTSQPLTDEEMGALYRRSALQGYIFMRSDWEQGVREGEAAHGIGAKK